MKESKQYAKQIDKLFRSLKKKHAKVKKVEYEDPVDAIVYAIISEHLVLTKTKAAMKKKDTHFVDLNDIRVSRVEEVAAAIGQGTDTARQTASELIRVLNLIYETQDAISLAEMKETGKKQAKKDIAQLNISGNFVLSYCFLAAIGGHAIPLTSRMIEFLRTSELVHPDATAQDIESFLERQINSANAYEFYYLLRKESESGKRSPRKAAKRKTTVKKTATKKKVKKTKKKKTKSK